jgi:hypothetical protein
MSWLYSEKSCDEMIKEMNEPITIVSSMYKWRNYVDVPV